MHIILAGHVMHFYVYESFLYHYDLHGLHHLLYDEVSVKRERYFLGQRKENRCPCHALSLYHK